MSAAARSKGTGGQDKGERIVPNPIPILNTAFLGILTWDFDKNPLPEVCAVPGINCVSYRQHSKHSLSLCSRP